MEDTVIEEIMKIIFDDNWIIPLSIFIIAVAVMKFIYEKKLPKYFQIYVSICLVAVAVLLMTVFFPWKTYLELEQIREIILLLLMTAIFGSTVGFVCQYRKTEKQLKTVIKIIEIDGNRIEAWKKLQKYKSVNVGTLAEENI